MLAGESKHKIPNMMKRSQLPAHNRGDPFTLGLGHDISRGFHSLITVCKRQQAACVHTCIAFF